MPSTDYQRLKPFLLTPLLMGLTSSAMAKEGETFADIFDRLIFATDIVGNFLHAASLVLGIGFMIYSLVAYRNHRLNPKMVPLDRPVLYAFIGIILAAVPFLGEIFERKTGQSHVQKHHKARAAAYYDDIDALDD